MRRLTSALVIAALSGVGALVFVDPASAACAPASPDPVTTVVEVSSGETAAFPVAGLCLDPSGRVEVVDNPSGASVAWTTDGSASAGFTVRPPSDDPSVAPVSILVENAEAGERIYQFVGFFGTSAQVNWGTGPVPHQLEVPVGGLGSFTLPGLSWPRYSECEIQVRNTPAEVDVVTEPPNLLGEPIALGVHSLSSFSGRVMVDYRIACTPPGGVRTEHTYQIELFVGVPIPPPPPQLAATGLEATTGLGLLGALLALSGIALTVRGRRLRSIARSSVD